ncbi:MAG: hypothetical protein GXX87_02170 [Euryarchaeota archaeon]|nr:hypothetical protein [Euryarchaeota archaeon]
MKVYSNHFILKGDSDYKDLAPVFPEILEAFLSEIGQMPEEEDIFQMFVELNMIDLRQNRKPEGYNRKGRIRMVFPNDRKEFYIKCFNKSTDMSRITQSIGERLTEAGVDFETESDLDMSF